jgi:hypothetical protein
VSVTVCRAGWPLLAGRQVPHWHPQSSYVWRKKTKARQARLDQAAAAAAAAAAAEGARAGGHTAKKTRKKSAAPSPTQAGREG